MPTSKKSIRTDDRLMQDIKSIAAEQSQTETQTIETALKYYRDYYYAKNRATILNEQVIAVVDAIFGRAKRDINARTNSVLSELAIQVGIQNLILAESLDIHSAKLNEYRLRVLDHLKTTNRVLRLDEVADE